MMKSEARAACLARLTLRFQITDLVANLLQSVLSGSLMLDARISQFRVQLA